MGTPRNAAALGGSCVFGEGVGNMPGTELALTEEYRIQHERTSGDYFITSADWAWQLISWVYQMPEYVTKNPGVLETCLGAMRRNNGWALQSLEIEAEQAIARGLRTRVIYPEDFAKIARFPHVEAELWAALETEFDPGEWDRAVDASNEPYNRPHGPATGSLADALSSLEDFVTGLMEMGYCVKGDEDGGFTVYEMGTDNEAYLMMDEAGNWRRYF